MLAENRADFDRVKRVLFYITIEKSYPKYVIDFSLTLKNRDSRPLLKVTIVLKSIIIFVSKV